MRPSGRTILKKAFVIAAAVFAMSAGAAFAQADPVVALDTNHDGAVQRSEFEAMVAANFAQMDANHDGQLTGDERPVYHSRPMELTQAQHAQSAMGMFNSEDTDHNGVISGDEVGRFREHALHGNTPAPGQH